MYTWQLDDLYPSYESRAFIEDFNALKELSTTMDQTNLDSTLEGAQKAISFLEKYSVLTRRLSAYIRLNLSVDTQDKISKQWSNRLHQLLSVFDGIITRYHTFLAQLPDSVIHDKSLSEYRFMLDKTKENNQYRLSPEVESALALMDLTGASSWADLQSYLTSSATAEFDGEELTLTQLRNLAYSEDADIRRRAYETELALYEAIKQPIAFAINNIKLQVINDCKLRGYQSPLEKTLMQSRMSNETLEALLEAIQKALPEFRRYLKQKAKLLGHDNGLPFYDLFAPLTESQQTYTPEEAKDTLVDAFSAFSRDLADLVETAVKERYIDFYPRKGKRGGAFCSNLPMIKQSRVMLNFDGSLSSLVTMAHELGHAYHGLHIQDHRPLNWSYSMPVAETASTFNEQLIHHALLQQDISLQDKVFLLEMQLSNVTQIIVDIYSRFLFEDGLFKAREDDFLFSNQLEALMLDAQKQAYGDGLDENFLHPYMWINKPHYYSAGLSYYNFPYAFGGLFAQGLFQQYLSQPDDFVERYQAFLKETTVASVEDAASKMGVDVTNIDFWNQILASYRDTIDHFIDLSNQL